MQAVVRTQLSPASIRYNTISRPTSELWDTLMRPSYRNKRLSGICVGLKITSPALTRIARPTVVKRSCTGRGRPAVPAKRSVQLSIFIFTSELGQHNHPQLERCALWDHRVLVQHLQGSDDQELSKTHPQRHATHLVRDNFKPKD